MARLKRTLEGIEDKETRIKIGAKDGSGFFYVGTVGDFLNHSDEYEQADIAYFDNRVRRSNNNLETILNTDTSYSGYAKRQYGKWKNTGTRPNFTMDGYEVFLRGHAVQVLKKFQTYISERQYRADRTSLMSRMVTNVFDADEVVEPAGVRVIQIEGKESGQFWTMDEAKWPVIKFSGNGDDNE